MLFFQTKLADWLDTTSFFNISLLNHFMSCGSHEVYKNDKRYQIYCQRP